MSDIIECSICLDFYSTCADDRFVTTHCGHVFHQSCITEWFEKASSTSSGPLSCPDCRKAARPNTLIVMWKIQPVHRVKTFKIVVIGDAGVGKTALSRKFCKGEFSTLMSPTVGVDLWTKDLEVGNGAVCLQIWDTAGHEKYNAITQQYMRGAQGVVIAYDTVHGPSFQSVRQWFNYANVRSPNAVKVLVGTKKDLTRCNACEGRPCAPVPSGQREYLAHSLEMYSFETSSATDFNVEVAFRTIAIQLLLNPHRARKARQTAAQVPPINLAEQSVRSDTNLQICTQAIRPIDPTSGRGSSCSC